MLTCIAFCHRDSAAAANLLRWMFELDGQQSRHDLLLVAAHGLDPVLIAPVKEAGQAAFRNVYLVSTARSDERPWPYAPNTMFRCAASFIRQKFASPFWWHEPDCIPLCSRWLDALESEYHAARRPFMGSVVNIPTRHLTGCAIYPRDPGGYNPRMMQADKIAWDCVAPHVTLRHTHHTDLFHHQWSDPTGAEVPTFPDRASLAIISPRAVVFHRCKDHTLIDRLREERAAGQAGPDARKATEAVEIKPEPVVAVAEKAQTDEISKPVDSSLASGPVQTSAVETGRAIPDAGVVDTSRPTVFAYHEAIEGFDDSAVIALWRESWSAWGWQPTLLGRADAENAVSYKGFIKAVSKLPTVNPPAYELACYKRWLAMMARGGGLMTDYDLMNYGFTPTMAKADLAKSPDALIFYEHKVPSAVQGGKDAFVFACQYLKSASANLKDTHDNRPHISDMLIMQRGWGKPWQRYVSRVVQYSDPGWQEALLVHFPNAKTLGPKPPRIRERYPFKA